jgi:hypothetical protein
VYRLLPTFHLVGPVVAGHTLADEPALQVGKRDEHGVDRAVRDLLLEFRGCQHPGHGAHECMVDRKLFIRA